MPKEEEKTASKDAKADKTAEIAKLPEVLLQPRISEKASTLVASNKYVFMVGKSANKVEIKKAVERMYKVSVTQVNIIKMKGKKKNVGRIAGELSDFKKAVVTLKEGDKIEGVTQTI